MAATEGLGFGVDIVTELRLGIPGSSGNNEKKKRVFWEEAGEKSPVTKTQVVGWPPVRAYRMKSFDKHRIINICSSVKVSMDGAICLRKIDLTIHKAYNALVVALEKLFGSIIGDQGLKDAESGEYKLIYQDKDGDWMLVGDVPWEMFTETCKRLRIMKKSEAKDIGVLKERDFLKSGQASLGDD